jgi:hypothetical protein
MTLALYVIASTVMVLVLSARLRSAQEELARAREEPGGSEQAADRDEQAVYAQAVALSLAYLLAGMAAWYAPPQRSARPAGAGRAGYTAGAGTDGGTAE